MSRWTSAPSGSGRENIARGMCYTRRPGLNAAGGHDGATGRVMRGTPEPSLASGGARPLAWGMTGYQWLVLLAAWLGWGFDAFDALLFNYVANLCVPDLRGLQIGTPEASAATTF